MPLPVLLVILVCIWLVLSIVFGFLYNQEPKRLIIAILLILVIFVLWWVWPHGF